MNPKPTPKLKNRMSSNYSTDSTSSDHHHHHQLNLFPLRPASNSDDRDVDDDNNVVEYLFNSAGPADASATTLTSIFGAAVVSTSSATSSSMTSTEDHMINYNHDHDHDHDLLLERTALRKRERDQEEEERWVCYSEVMSSSKIDHDKMMMMKKKKMIKRRQRLELKLDYEDIINTWGQSFIHIQMDSPATVPDLCNYPPHHQSTFIIPPHQTHGGETSVGGREFYSDGGLWRVPESEKRWSNNNNTGENVKIKEEGIESGQHLREASMLRYKEKRQSRLFSKRIRYQVRKINAEKRPRLKGRFVKRS